MVTTGVFFHLCPLYPTDRSSSVEDGTQQQQPSSTSLHPSLFTLRQHHISLLCSPYDSTLCHDSVCQPSMSVHPTVAPSITTLFTLRQHHISLLCSPYCSTLYHYSVHPTTVPSITTLHPTVAPSITTLFTLRQSPLSLLFTLL